MKTEFAVYCFVGIDLGQKSPLQKLIFLQAIGPFYKVYIAYINLFSLEFSISEL